MTGRICDVQLENGVQFQFTSAADLKVGDKIDLGVRQKICSPIAKVMAR